jgi:Lon protease-like protein
VSDGEERPVVEPDVASALASACVALKIFPLPGVVLLPGVPTPFHLFEPRYRALAAAALAGDRVLAVPTLVDAAEAMSPRARLRPVAGAGLIVADQRNPDGTFDIVVASLGRVRLAGDLERGAPFREVRAEPLEDLYPAGGAASLAGQLELLVELCAEVAHHLPSKSGAGRLAEAVARMPEPGAAADLVASAAIAEPEARYRVMEALDVELRLRIVTEELAGLLLRLPRGKTPSA